MEVGIRGGRGSGSLRPPITERRIFSRSLRFPGFAPRRTFLIPSLSREHQRPSRLHSTLPTQQAEEQEETAKEAPMRRHLRRVHCRRFAWIRVWQTGPMPPRTRCTRQRRRSPCCPCVGCGTLVARLGSEPGGIGAMDGCFHCGLRFPLLSRMAIPVRGHCTHLRPSSCHRAMKGLRIGSIGPDSAVADWVVQPCCPTRHGQPLRPRMEEARRGARGTKNQLFLIVKCCCRRVCSWSFGAGSQGATHATREAARPGLWGTSRLKPPTQRLCCNRGTPFGSVSDSAGMGDYISKFWACGRTGPMATWSRW